MPFLINPTESFSKESIKNWKHIEWEVLQEYRAKFARRVDQIQDATGLDFTSDLRAIELRTHFFNDLIQNAEDGHYLVALYFCDPTQNEYRSLNVGLCIKRKGEDGNEDVIIGGKIYDCFGTPINLDYFPSLHSNYLARRAKINHRFPGALEFDREGRAHLINEDMKLTVQKLFDNGNEMYVYFILDDFLDAKETLSVVFADQKINFEDFPFDDPDGYDHGTACCPIP